MNVHSFYGAAMDKRKKILDAAEVLLAERGFYGLSMKLLADHAGIAAGTIYRYFENKDDMINQLHLHIKQEIVATIFTGVDDSLSEKEKYSLFWRNAYHSALKNPNRVITISMLCLRPNAEGNEIFTADENLFAPLINFYAKGIREQRFYDFPITVLIALSFESAINMAKKVMSKSIKLDEALIEQIIDVSWNAILKPAY